MSQAAFVSRCLYVSCPKCGKAVGEPCSIPPVLGMAHHIRRIVADSHPELRPKTKRDSAPKKSVVMSKATKQPRPEFRRNCQNCGLEFTTTRRVKSYCEMTCQMEASVKRQNKKRGNEGGGKS